MQIVKSFLRLMLHYVDCSAIKSLQRCSLQQTYKLFFFFSGDYMRGFDVPFLCFFQTKRWKKPVYILFSFLSEGFCV